MTTIFIGQTFNSIDVGDFFVYGNDLFIKIDAENNSITDCTGKKLNFAAMCIATGEIRNIGAETSVVKVNVSIRTR